MPTPKSLESYVALVSAVGVLVTLVALHFLSPELDPSWRMVSEYANGQYSWVLSLMFLCWAISSWTLAKALSTELTTKLGKISLALLVISGIGEAMAAFFDINHALHGLSAFIGIGSFPFAAIGISMQLAKMKKWSPYKKSLGILAHLSWISVVLMMLSFAVLISTYIKAGGDMSAGPVSEIPDGVIAIVGWANRFLILVYSLWLMTAAWGKRKTQLL